MAEHCENWINLIDSELSRMFKASNDLDGFIKYKNTTPIDLSQESMAKLFLINNAKDVKWIWLYTKSWIPVSYTDEYYTMRDYLIWYADRDDFMWMFRMLYWEDEEAFRVFQNKVRDDMDLFFRQIEKWRIKETQQEYFFRLIRLIRDDEYNDVKLLLALHPDMRETLTYEPLFKNYFWVDFTNPRDYRRVRDAITRQWWFYARVPKLRLWEWNILDKDFWQQSRTSHSYYMYLPDDMKVFYRRKQFELPEWVELRELSWEKRVLKWWDNIYVTNDQFLKLSREDQEKLFDIVFDAYKAEEPENLQLLEESIQRTKDNFTKAHISWTWLSAVYYFVKMFTNPITYAATLIMHKTWAIVMLALNSFLHVSRYLANEWQHIWYYWDWWQFCKQQKIFEKDYWFWDLIKWAYREKWLKWLWDSLTFAYIWLRKEFMKVAEAQFFNIADTAMTSYYRRNIAEEYLSIKYPHINSFEEYSNMLSIMSRWQRKQEIEDLVKYVDDKMYKRYNNSVDTTRFTKWWILLPEWLWWDYMQEVTNLIWSLWMFYRRYMVNYADNVMSTIKEWRRWTTQAEIRELMEQYYSWARTREEVCNIIDARFANNQDLSYLLSTALYSFLISKSLMKYDIHWNWYDEENMNDAVMLSELLDLYELFFFPIEAAKKTWMWMWIESMFDAISTDLSVWDNAKLIAWSEYKMIWKQLSKWLWMVKWLFRIIWDLAYNRKDEWSQLSTWEKADRVWKDFTEAIHWYWYYLLDDISREWFVEYTPKTQTTLMKDIFWTREYAIKWYDDINSKVQLLKNTDSIDKFWQNWVIYNTPFISQYYKWQFKDKTWVTKAMDEWYNTIRYHQWANWEIPKDTTDSEWHVYYWMMTKYNPTDLDDISLNFLVDWSWEDDDWNTIHDYEKEAKEKIWHDLMIENVDENLLKEAVRLFTTADKTYQWQALSALLYLDAQTPWAWQKLLWYLANYELTQNVYFSWKYWYFKKQDNWKYSMEDEIKRQEAMRQEKINIAKKYFEYEYILDKEIWNQATLKDVKDHPEYELSKYIKDTSENWYSNLWIYPEIDKQLYTDTSLWEMYKLHTYATIAAAEWYPDWYKLNNMFSKLFSKSWKTEDWKLTEEWAKVTLFAYNALNEMLKDMWMSDPERVVMQSVALLQSDQALNTVINSMTPEEAKNDPTIQSTLHFLWWTANKINQLSDRAIAETVQKNQVWEDPSDIALSRATNSNWISKKHWYSNWKQYYNNNKYFYDQVKYMTSKYHKYYNYLYTPKTTNVTKYYSQKERDAKKFWPALATIKWSWGGWRRDSKQQKSWWSLTQRWWKARPFTNRWDLDKIPDRRTKPKNRRTRAYAIGSKLRNKLIPWRRRYIKARQSDIPTIS